MPFALPRQLRAPQLSFLFLIATATAASAAPVAAAGSPVAPPTSELRWTDETPDAMVEDAKARATAKGASEADALAALETIAGATSAEVRTDAMLLARAAAPDEGSRQGASADAKLGVLSNLAILGPFRDTGGGLDLHDGPEGQGASFADMKARYSWGTVDVAWRPVPPHYATAKGVPLDLFIHPRTESCSYVATAITVPSRRPMVVHVAATGSV